MRIWWQMTVVLAAALAAWVPLPPPLIERWYSAGPYPVIQTAATSATNLLPIALLDILLLVATGVLLIGGLRAARAAWATRSAAPLLTRLARLIAWGAILYLAFLFLWGFNYRRLPMAQRLVLSEAAVDEDAVVALGLEAAGRVNTLHAAAHRAGGGRVDWRDGALRRSFVGVQQRLVPVSPATPGRPKSSLLGPYFRWTSVDGMINPFGLEVLLNPDLLPFERPFVIAHEWGHLAGFADESEASFVGWLTCLGGDAAAQYSGWLFLYWQVGEQVGADNRRRLGEALDAGPRADVEAVAARLARGRWPALRSAGWAVYDEYLKANRVDEGIRSYGAVVTLILRTRVGAVVQPVTPRGSPR